MKETPNDKFIRLAESRMTRIFVNLNLMCNCSVKSNYEFNQTQVKQIFTTLFSRGEDVKKCFERNIDNEPLEIGFSLSKDVENSSKKSIKFHEISEKRISKILQDLNLIGNLANKKHYRYTDQEVDELFEAYFEQCHIVKSHFEEIEMEFKFSKNR